LPESFFVADLDEDVLGLRAALELAAEEMDPDAVGRLDVARDLQDEYVRGRPCLGAWGSGRWMKGAGFRAWGLRFRA